MTAAGASGKRDPAAEVSPVAAEVPAGDRVFPLSFAQVRLWLLDRLVADRSVFNVPMRLRLAGALNVEALRHALNGVVARHDVLRAHMRWCPPDVGCAAAWSPNHEDVVGDLRQVDRCRRSWSRTREARQRIPHKTRTKIGISKTTD